MYYLLTARDYSDDSIIFEFKPDEFNSRRKCMDLNITIDSRVENAELFSATLVKSDLSLSQEVSTAVITITDSTGKVS